MLRREDNLEYGEFYQGTHTDNKPNGTLEFRKLGGVVYTPIVLADYVAQKVIELYTRDQKSPINPNDLRVLDPACGKGELLISVWRVLVEKLPVDRHCPIDVLCGIDIDKGAISRARIRINQLADPGTKSTKDTNLINTNSLFPFDNKHSKLGWNKVKRQFEAGSGFDIIIANPPWGADLSNCANQLSQAEFSMCRGQYDSSDLFLESAVSNLREGGYLAFIIPDSLFSQEREGLRKFLLDNTEIRFIGRLGEKFFGGVNRACAVVICKKTSDTARREIHCLRLTPETRKAILEGQLNFKAVEKLQSHLVPHTRFENNKGYQFDIDLTSHEETTLSRILAPRHSFRDHLTGTRGVELSKYGKVYECAVCKKWSPFPSSTRSTCPHCKTGFSRDEVLSMNIVTQERKKKLRPIIVGECIQRNVVSGRRWIDISKKGINYKNYVIYKSPKIVVRKTGVGISAAMDYKDSLTNQVVYVFKPVEDCDIPLEFYLGVLSSRAIYYYIAKSHGETEWRSHPYVTQKQILDIPIPSKELLKKNHADLIELIGRTVKGFTQSNKPITNEADAIIERAVAKLYGLDRFDYNIIFQTLKSSQDLLPVRALKHIDIKDIFDLKGI